MELRWALFWCLFFPVKISERVENLFLDPVDPDGHRDTGQGHVKRLLHVAGRERTSGVLCGRIPNRTWGRIPPQAGAFGVRPRMVTVGAERLASLIGWMREAWEEEGAVSVRPDGRTVAAVQTNRRTRIAIHAIAHEGGHDLRLDRRKAPIVVPSPPVVDKCVVPPGFFVRLELEEHPGSSDVLLELPLLARRQAELVAGRAHEREALGAGLGPQEAPANPTPDDRLVPHEHERRRRPRSLRALGRSPRRLDLEPQHPEYYSHQRRSHRIITFPPIPRVGDKTLACLAEGKKKENFFPPFLPPG